MSQIEILPASSHADFAISCSPPTISGTFPRYNENLTWTDLDAAFDHQDTLTHSPNEQQFPEGGLSLFEGLPPLLHGHREIHLRNGVMNASRLAADQEPDAERAFFVADLSEVYRQFQRWKTALPDIEPHYGL